MGQNAFLTCRLDNVRGEFSITALAYNLRLTIKLVGIPAMIAVVSVWTPASPTSRSRNQAKYYRQAGITVPHSTNDPIARHYRRDYANANVFSPQYCRTRDVQIQVLIRSATFFGLSANNLSMIAGEFARKLRIYL